MQRELARDFVVDYGVTRSDNLSEDGTRKWLFGFDKGAEVECESLLCRSSY